MPKLKDIEDEGQALAALGMTDDTPPEAGVTTPEPEPEPAEETEPVGTPQTDEGEAVAEPQEEKATEEQRRTWQGDADRAKKEAEDAKAETEKIRQIAQMQAQQIQNMANIAKPFTQKYQQEEKEPDISFIEDGFFDENKFKTWLARHDDSVASKASENAVTTLEQKQSEQTLIEQARELCKDHPEFINPISGEPDMDRIISAVQNKTRGMSLKQVLGYDQKPAGFDVDAIGKHANKPSSVVGSQETTKEPKPISGDAKTLADIGFDPGQLGELGEAFPE